MKKLLYFLAVIAVFAGCSKKAEPEPKPVADFEYAAGPNGFIQFSNTSSNAIRYQWNFGDGGVSTETSPAYRHPKGGRYTVSLIAKNNEGAEDIVQKNVIVSEEGNYIFWTSFNGVLDYYVDDKFVGSNTTYRSDGTAPTCGNDNGLVKVTLNEGLYLFTAKERGLFGASWKGSFTISRGQCKTLQLTK